MVEMGLRKQKRIRVALPVRVTYIGAGNRLQKEFACTLDIAPMGARLGGINQARNPGEIVTLERGKSKAMFRVVWVGERGTAHQGQVGVQCIEPGANLWEDIQFPTGPDDEYDAKKTAGAAKKPAATRYLCPGTAKVLKEGVNLDPIAGTLRDISIEGCYVRTLTPLNLSTGVIVNLDTPHGKIGTKGTVRTSEGAMGMWIEFGEMNPNDRRPLEELIEKLARK